MFEYLTSLIQQQLGWVGVGWVVGSFVICYFGVSNNNCANEGRNSWGGLGLVVGLYPCKIVLLTLVAPRGVTDLYLS